MQLLNSTDKSAAEIERELGIAPGLLSRWKRKTDGRGEYAMQTASTTELTAAQLRIKQLERENTILRQERDILKKRSSFSGTIQSDEIRVHQDSSR